MHYHHPHHWHHTHCCTCYLCWPHHVHVPVVVEQIVVQKVVKQIEKPSSTTRNAARRNRHAIKALAGR